MDFKIYLDISDEVKFAWKIQRDMAERGHSLESIKASIEARKPDFDAYIDIQKKHADVIIQARAPSVLGTRSWQRIQSEGLRVENIFDDCVLSNASTCKGGGWEEGLLPGHGRMPCMNCC